MNRVKHLGKGVIPYIGLFGIICFFQIITQGQLLQLSNYKILLNNIIPVMLGACGLCFLMSMGNFDRSMSGVSLRLALGRRRF